MATQLDIFDFDGTLVKTPLDTPENRRKFEKATGIPWLIDKNKSRELSKKHGKFIGMRRGWFGRRETLEPPLVPDPTPKDLFIPEPCQALKESKANPETITLLMTGRHGGLRNQVLRIAGDGGLVEIRRKKSQKDLFCDIVDSQITCWFLGDKGPAPQGTIPSETLPWKFWIIDQYLTSHPSITKVVIWEDREEHAKEFRELNELVEPEVVVQFVQN